ncbi:LysE family translocator [Vibrio vulnificus]|nr:MULTISPECIES: LysE family translocator [Vibrio]EHK9018818.1 LysE family translocator [Vibrio vulnificus]EHU4998539.1 LysE family translocator [Vibrio vulnificus]ELV8679705.1 LysE family translocator [Vibrio vulnificus]EME0159196.1 LysE family translocator [Vibrio vulnificus]MBE3659131.1 lysine transporter LysE [Vibrio navarrensis]
MEHLYAVVLFAVSSSVTPGPNNIMVMTSGLNFGVKKSLPLLTGICVGFTVMLLLVGLGFAQLFVTFPSLHLIIKCVGVLYLLYLAYLIARSAGKVESSEQSQPFTFMKGALFQWVNAKAWVVATGAIAAFTTVGASFFSQNLMIAATFFLVSFPCVGVWLMFGSMLKNALNSPRSRSAFNYVMSGLLVLSVVPVASEIIEQLA